QNTLVAISADGAGRKNLDTQDSATGYFGSIQQYEAQELLVQISHQDGSAETFYSYDYQGNYTKNTTATQDDLQKGYPTYLIATSGKQTLWSESRDGKNTLFIGDADAKNEKEVASLSEYKQYGWYTDNYLLVSKNSSELYILSKDGLKGGQTPIK